MADTKGVDAQVSCAKCFADGESVFHLHCSYCDEILTGSIAQPGGKVSDHVITIRFPFDTTLHCYYGTLIILSRYYCYNAKAANQVSSHGTPTSA